MLPVEFLKNQILKEKNLDLCKIKITFFVFVSPGVLKGSRKKNVSQFRSGIWPAIANMQIYIYINTYKYIYIYEQTA